MTPKLRFLHYYLKYLWSVCHIVQSTGYSTHPYIQLTSVYFWPNREFSLENLKIKEDVNLPINRLIQCFHNTGQFDYPSWVLSSSSAITEYSYPVLTSAYLFVLIHFSYDEIPEEHNNFWKEQREMI